MKKIILFSILSISVYFGIAQPLHRSTPQAENVDPAAFTNYFEDVKQNKQELHSLMVLRNGKVISENWFGDNAPDKNHVMYSVSKTFAATAVGFAVHEKKLKLDDKVISFFKDSLPENISPNLAAMEIRHLLTMTVGHSTEAMDKIREGKQSWERIFLAHPVEHKPGEKFLYNSLATYMLSAIMQKVTGQTLMQYLEPRLFQPLGIKDIEWQSSPSGVNIGGWGMFIKTEDMAKLGKLFLQDGLWNGKQVVPKDWIVEARKAHVVQPPQWIQAGSDLSASDWTQGYGYQMWRCRNNAYRADGLNGQFIIVVPEKNAVIVTTANIPNMQEEINLIWKHILPALK